MTELFLILASCCPARDSHPLKDLGCLLVLHEDVVDACLKHNEVVGLALATGICQLLLQQGVKGIQHTSTTKTCGSRSTLQGARMVVAGVAEGGGSTAGAGRHGQAGGAVGREQQQRRDSSKGRKQRQQQQQT